MRHSWRSTVLTCLGVLIALPSAAQFPPPPPQPVGPLPSGTSAIAGRITDAQSGEPLAEVRLSLSAVTQRGFGATTSKPDGTYAFEGIAAGTYRLSAERASYARRSFGATDGNGIRGAAIDVAAGARVERIDIAMPRGAIVRGRVTDENGQPIVRATVMVGVRNEQRGDVSGLVRPAEADERGNYEVRDLPAGDLYVVGNGVGVKPGPIARGAVIPQYQRTFYPGVTSVDTATTIRTAAGEVTAGIDFAVRHKVSGTLTARVVHSSGTLPDSIALIAVGLQGGGMHQMNVRGFQPDGRATLLRMGLGPYLVFARVGPGTATEAAWTRVDVDTDTPEITLTLAPTAVLSGRVVTESGEPWPTAGVRLRASLASNAGGPLVPTMQVDMAELDAAGAFRLPGLFGERVLRLDGQPQALTITRIIVDGRAQTPDEPITFPSGRHLQGVQVVVGTKDP